MPELNIPIALGTDDAIEPIGGFTRLTDTTMISDDPDEWIGLRFQNVTIPAGSTITAAYVTMRVISQFTDSPRHDFYGEKVANPGTFTTAGFDISNRARTTATMLWDDPDLGAAAAGSHIVTPDISAIVQEIVDQVDWASGNALVIMFHAVLADTARDLGIQAFEHANADSPAELHVTYTEGGGGGGEVGESSQATKLFLLN